MTRPRWVSGAAAPLANSEHAREKMSGPRFCKAEPADSLLRSTPRRFALARLVGSHLFGQGLDPTVDDASAGAGVIIFAHVGGFVPVLQAILEPGLAAGADRFGRATAVGLGHRARRRFAFWLGVGLGLRLRSQRTGKDKERQRQKPNTHGDGSGSTGGRTNASSIAWKRRHHIRRKPETCGARARPRARTRTRAAAACWGQVAGHAPC